MQMPWQQPTATEGRDGLTWSELLVVVLVFAVIVVILISTRLSA